MHEKARNIMLVQQVTFVTPTTCLLFAANQKHIFTVAYRLESHPQKGHRGRRRPRNAWKRDPQKEMWIAGYKQQLRGKWRQELMETSCL